MSNDHNYRPRSPDLSGLGNQQPAPRLNRLPSLPHGYSFSPRGSYDASPFFSPSTQQPTSSYFNAQVGGHTTSYQSPPQFTQASLPRQQSQPISGYSPPFTQSPPRFPEQAAYSGHDQQFSTSRIPPYPQNLQNSAHFPPGQSFQSPDDMARLRQRKPVNYNENQNGQAQYEEPLSYIPQQAPIQIQQPQQPFQPSFQQPLQAPPLAPVAQQQKPAVLQEIPPNIDVKTKFPVARIKRIMQADEDVGKVAQATPTAVSKALEMFIIALVVKGAAEAKHGNSKRVTATHLKTALLNDEKFDFLNEICESVPDEGSKKSRIKGETKSEHDEMDSDDSANASKKKAKVKKRKGTSEAESD